MKRIICILLAFCIFTVPVAAVGEQKRFTPNLFETYVIINKATGRALTLEEGNCRVRPLTYGENQLWTVRNIDGAHYVVSPSGIVNEHLKISDFYNPDGVSVYIKDPVPIAWQFYWHEGAGGTMYTGLSVNESGTGDWIFTPVTGAKSADTRVYRSISIRGVDAALNFNSEGVLSVEAYNGGEEQQWTFDRYIDGSYVIAGRTGVYMGEGREPEIRCIDVLNGWTDPGVGVITYRIYATANQRWIPEKQADGSYLLKSAASGLYLTEKEGSFSQEELGAEGNQYYIIKVE